MRVWLRRKLIAQGQGQTGAIPTISHSSASSKKPAPGTERRQASMQAETETPRQREGKQQGPRPSQLRTGELSPTGNDPFLDAPNCMCQLCLACATQKPSETTEMMSRAGDDDDGDEGSLGSLVSG